MLAVSDDCKGLGYGSKILRDFTLPYIKEQNGKIVTLATNSEINCRFYQKNGFVQFDYFEKELGGNNVGSWCFLNII